jgi:hypothetical protein
MKGLIGYQGPRPGKLTKKVIRYSVGPWFKKGRILYILRYFINIFTNLWYFMIFVMTLLNPITLTS